MTESTARETVTLDRVDEQIVRALQLAPRASFHRIGEVLELSEQTVARRYRRIRRAGALRVVGAVDPAPLGLADWLVRIRCRPAGTLPVAESLARREDVSWVNISAGGAEVSCALRCRSDAARDDLLVHRLPGTVPVLGITACVVLHRFIGNDPTDWEGFADRLTAEQTAQLLTPGRPAAQPGSLRPDDGPLLAALARDGRDGRASLAQLARASRTTQGRVARRLSALEASGILYFDVDLAATVVSVTTSAGLWLTVEPAHLDSVGHTVLAHHQVAYAAAVTGPANLYLSAGCRSLDELYRFLTGPLAAIPGIRAVEVVPTQQRLKQAGALITGNKLAPPSPTPA